MGWPDTVPLHAFVNGPISGTGPLRPSWCYGTPGIGRALQLAALARGNEAARQFAEQVVLGSITDPLQLAQIRDATLCHGLAGLLLTCDRVASDAVSPAIAKELPALRARLDAHLVQHDIPKDAGLLTGRAGVLLALHTLNAPSPFRAGRPALF
ncbi:lanthionine synthetase LanC family protein [Streptomyces sp. NPDC127063]|uniref:lanthionine synthetase LanC family protein n=1 Tax=Streptomyces sp. NPDC127063 TaxID=3347123 RepID=UPI0036578BC4